MHDLPRGPGLLAIARDVLLNDLLPLLPPERRLDARLVANCMAVAEREAEETDAPLCALVGELSQLYEQGGASPSRYAGPSLSPPGGEREGARGAASQCKFDEATEPWRRFARDLRIGAFENSPAREAQARAMLWHLTIARLRLANPRFLAANGFGQPGGFPRRG